MPGKVKVKIVAGRNLPVMDRSSDTTDAYVEIKLGNTTYKTDVCRKSLNPQWNSEWYRFEVDDAELQDEPLQIRLMDHDTYSANDAIGKVYLDLNPLLLPAPSKDCPQPSATNVTGSTMSGWLPVYDTMHGIRGEVNVIVKVELFSDFNKFRQSSCGVQFFCSPIVPQGFHIQVMHGFVEELVVNDDPEYQWIDKIRTPRASNEARQTLFLKLSGEVQRKIGLKALDLGGNAVLGYHQCFDLERESGIVARGIGTAVSLVKLHDSALNHSTADHAEAVPPLPPSPRLLIRPKPDDDQPILIGPRFPKPKAQKHRPSPVVVVDLTESKRPHRQVSAPGGLNKMSKSIVSDLCELRNLLEQEDLRQIEPGSSRFAKAIRFIPKKVSALKSRLQSDDPDADTMSYSSALSTKSLSISGRRRKPRAYQRCSSDSVAAALIRSIMMDAGGSGGLDRVMEKEESVTRLASSDNDEDLIYGDSSQISSSCDSSTSDDLSDESGPSPETSSSSLLKDSSISSVRRIGRLTPKVQDDPQYILKLKSLKKKERSASPLSTKSLESPRDKVRRRPPSSPAGSRSLEAASIPSPKKKSFRLPPSPEQRASPIPPPILECEPKHVLPAVSIEVADEGSFSTDNDNDNDTKLEAKSEKTSMSEPNQVGATPSGSCCNSLTLAASPSVLIPLHKSRSATSLACPAPDPVQGEEDTLPSSPGPPTTTAPTAPKYSQSPAKGSYVTAGPHGIITGIHRRSSDSDLSITPKGNSLTGSDRSSVTGATHPNKPMPSIGRPPAINQENVDMLEYPFLTMSKYPPNFIIYIGGNVSCRSVKLLQRITNLEEPETRDAWWKEIRMEVRSHARALGCNVVLGYSENTSICDDVCVLSASGTAAVINMQANPTPADDLITASQEQQHTPPPPTTQNPPYLTQRTTNRDRVVMTTSLDRNDFERERFASKGDTSAPVRTDAVKPRRYSDGADETALPPCVTCHVPYNGTSVPFTIRLRKCAVCRRGKVPDVLFATIEPPDIPVTGRGCLMQAYVCRPKRDCKGELNAKEISDGLPFLEYELHRLLVNKLRVKGMNAIFGLKVNVSIGERMLVGLATGTAVYLTALPPPPVPTITAGNSWKDDTKLTQVQRTIQEAVKRNRELYRLKPPPEADAPSNGCRNPSDTEESEDELQDLDLATGNKDTCVLEVDDNEDVDVISLLIDPAPPEGFLSVNLESVPGLDDMEAVRNLQMFTQVWRAKVVPGAPLTTFSRHFHRVLQSVFFKLRRTVPCALSKLQYRVELPEPDELQLCLLGMAIGLGEADKTVKFRRKPVQSTSKETLKRDEGDLIFSLEEDVSEEASASSSLVSPPTSAGLPRPRPRSPHRGRQHNTTKLRHTPPRERYGVDITPLSYIPGGKIERYLGNVNFFLIRESTAIKESGGLSGFVHSFMAEVLAIVRAHVTALGGNAMVAYFISENVLFHNAHKNQGQCLINVGGDVVLVSYPGN